jgi:hypothetical protein
MKGDAAMSIGITSERSHSFLKSVAHGMLSLLSLMVFAANTLAAEVLLTWEANSESDLAGYRIHYGTSSGEYTHIVDVGNVTDCTIGALKEGLTYYFAATAYDSAGKESDYSSEISLYAEPEATLDTDEDGMADIWETECFGSLDRDGSGDFDSDGICDLDEFLEGTDPAVSDVTYDMPLLEVGEIEVNDIWTRITFNQSFTDPVVVARVQTHNGSRAVVAGIRNVDATGFDVRIQAWDYQKETPLSERIAYLVIEGGSYELSGGARLEAERFEADSDGSFETVTFNQAFQHTPVVLTGVTSFNETDTVTSRVRNINTTGFEFTMQEQEANVQHHAAEIIAYIAWEPSIGALASVQFEVNNTADGMSHRSGMVAYGREFVNIPFILADMQTTNDDDTATLVLEAPAADSVGMRIEEERSSDYERYHQDEAVGYMLFEIL